MITYNALVNDAKNTAHVIGYIDDNERKVGKKINMLNVYHPSSITKDFINKNQFNTDEACSEAGKIGYKGGFPLPRGPTDLGKKQWSEKTEDSKSKSSPGCDDKMDNIHWYPVFDRIIQQHLE